MSIKQELRPWHQQPGETDAAFKGFQQYLKLDPSVRTLAEAYRQRTGNFSANSPAGFFHRWSVKHGWKQRALAHDNHLLIVAEDAQAAELAKWAAGQERRQLQAQKEANDLADALHKRAEEMLKYPLTEKRMEKDGQTIIVQPVRWSLDTLPKILDTIKSLRQFANDMSTERKELVIRHELQQLSVEIGIPYEELEREFKSIQDAEGRKG